MGSALTSIRLMWPVVKERLWSGRDNTGDLVLVLCLTLIVNLDLRLLSGFLFPHLQNERVDIDAKGI